MNKGVKTGAMWIVGAIIVYVIWMGITYALVGSVTSLAWAGNYGAAASAAQTYVWISSVHWIVMITCALMALYGVYKIVTNW